MPSRITPPSLPFRSSDENSKWLSNKLALAYPMLEGGGSLVKNYGFWGEDGDLLVTGATRQRGSDGLHGMHFTNPTDSLSSGAIQRTLSGPWSYAFWMRMDAAPTGTPESIFSLHGSIEKHVASWADATGIWSWQKRDIADTYSILPTADFSVNKTMLVIASYEGTYLPPAQLRTKQSLSFHPSQPNVYASYNDGTGVAASQVESITIGNSVASSEGFKGYLGPFYFWDRALAESEVWQLWQDPYAPFRRATAQNVNLSTLSSAASNSLQGTGKLTGVRPILQDDNGLFISIQDYFNYVDKPEDELIQAFDGPLTISVADNYSYQDSPIEALTSPNLIAWPQLTISVADSYIYQDIPTELLTVPNVIATTAINVSDTYSYQIVPTEQVTAPGGAAPTTISLSDNYSYQNTPSENITTTIT